MERAPQTHAPAKQSLAIRWVFTLWDYSTASLEQIESHPDIVRAVWQEEQSPSTGVLHIQGYLELAKEKRWRNVFTILSYTSDGDEARAWCEPAKGTPWENHTYCTKPERTGFHRFVKGTFTEPRSEKRARKKVRHEDMMDDITDKKMTVTDIAKRYPEEYLRQSRGIQELVNRLRDPIPIREVTTIVIHGYTGVGKSRWAHQYAHWHGFSMWTKKNTVANAQQWFQGYDGQDVILLDDFDGCTPFRELLNWLDIYDAQVDQKGGSAQLRNHTFIITSNQEPSAWYRESASTLAPLMRRLHHVYEIPEGVYADTIIDYKIVYKMPENQRPAALLNPPAPAHEQNILFNMHPVDSFMLTDQQIFSQQAHDVLNSIPMDMSMPF